MSPQELIENYGYLAILVVTFIEGETIVILAGIAAHLGLLEMPWVIVSALAGSFSGDQLWYYIGRHWGPKILKKRPHWQTAADKVYKHLHRHQYWLILTFRFYYGLRNVTPFAVGSAGIPRVRFFTLNLIGGIVWALTFTYAGYLLGETMRLFIDDYHRYALYVIGAVVAVLVVLWVTAFLRARRKLKELSQK
jgi:membrane protein DedA with SNARE-associated domain